MEIKRIIVDEISGGRGVNKVLADVVIIFTVGNTISQATKKNCLVEIEEEECVWKKKDKATDGDYDIYVSPHYPYIYRSSLDFFPPTFCRDCGKRIKYVEVE